MKVHSSSGSSAAVYIGQITKEGVSRGLWYVIFNCEPAKKIEMAHHFLSALKAQQSEVILNYSREEYDGLPQVGFLYMQTKARLRVNITNLLKQLEDYTP